VSGVTIIVPVYNEAPTIEAALAELLAVELPVARQIVVVDDGSTDGTRELLLGRDEHPDVAVVLHERNLGKGAAVRTGLKQATGRYATIFDADREYPATNLAPLLQPLLDGSARVVFGTRGFRSHASYGFWYVLGNKFVTLATNVMFDSWISDVMTCHKALETDLFRALSLRERGFAIEAEIAARVLARGLRIYEVPVEYVARSREDGKKLTSLDGLRVLRTLVRCRLF
jgi:glycosyltransferase involved in cell wall biosynthesis